MLAESDDKEENIASVAAFDAGKAELVCYARLPELQGSPKTVVGRLWDHR